MGYFFDFVANTRDGVMAVDGQQRIVLWNEAATNMLGYEAPQVLGKLCYSVIRGRDAHGCALCRRRCRVMRTAGELDLPESVDVEAMSKDGSNVWLNVSTVVVPSSRGELSAVVHLFREVTQRQEGFRILSEFAQVVGRIAESGDRPASRRGVAAEAPVVLTRREREVLAFLAAGVATPAIADRLGISSRTVRNHVSNVLTKLGVHSRLEAVTYSIRNGLV